MSKQPIRLTQRGEDLKEAAGAVIVFIVLPLSILAMGLLAGLR